jgi:formate dehydrogenase iron-sulfur subunit
MSTSRRGFLKGVAAGTLVAGTAKAGSTKHFGGYPGRYGLLHDSTLCVGCRSCEFACNEVNGLPPPEAPVDDKAVFGEKRGPSDKLYTVVNEYKAAEGNKPAVYRKHQCMHCNEPCCASVCFVKAFVKTPEGPVLYDPDVCVGCRYCVFACPYYALAYEYDDPATPRVVRCTMCYPRIKEGKNPACADACPNGAIQFGKREELIKVAHERMRKYPGRYINHIFGEHEYGGTSWLTLIGEPPKELGLPDEVSHDPLPNLTTNFLSLAPLVAAIFPGLLAGMYAFAKRKDVVSKNEHEKAMSESERRAKQELEEELSAAARQAERDKERAVERAVRAAKRQEPPTAPAPDSKKEESP